MRIVAAMSGGVDSSVAAALLTTDGHDVIGLSMQLYNQVNGKYEFGSCCTLDDLADARRVAARLGIPHYIVNFERQFEEHVISHFVQEYVNARTPIPCVQCNSDLKFSSLLERARGLNADYVATGHYARVAKLSTDDGSDIYQLRRAIDDNKDQSYFLFSLTQEQLSRACFPLGELTKSAVRAHARTYGLNVADKPDSHEICFVPDGQYADFVESRTPKISTSGNIVNHTGETIGQHAGIHRFTIGQRKGLGLSSDKPLYVTALDAQSSTVTVGPRHALEQTRLTASNINWIFKAPPHGTHVSAQIRHHHPVALCRVWADDKGLELEFEYPQQAIAPGQAVVIYDGDLVLGGGWIE